MMFQRRHYDKALIVALSNMEYWKTTDHPLTDMISSSLNAFDEYHVDNFHSILHAHTKATDNEETISQVAREIDARKHRLHHFQSSFVPPRKKTIVLKALIF